MTSTYLVYQALGGTFHDARKMGPADSNLCWAASAANVLAWGGWGQIGPHEPPSSAQAIFEQYKAESGIGNVQGFPKVLWEWWLNKYNPFFQQDAADLIWDYGVAGRPDAMARIETCFRTHNAGVAIQAMKQATQVGQGDVSHFVTCWGFDFDPAIGESDVNRYLRIHITDSDDAPAEPQLRTYPVAKGDPAQDQNPNYWYIQGLVNENNYFLGDIYALSHRTPAAAPLPDAPTGLHIR
jgi:hypothetical protein